jgi:hypothetical protein
MNRHISLLVVASAMTLTSCSDRAVKSEAKIAEGGQAAAAPAGDPMASALSAAPASIARHAAVMMPAADGSMKELRKGSNGFTCMPDNPVTPGPDPMCADANAMQWAAAWIGHKPPAAVKVGLMYMLAGGTDASNMDPYATAPAKGGEWVKTGPHVMVVGSPSLNKLYPSSDKPDTSKPYVMFGGTPYAHVMMPIG